MKDPGDIIAELRTRVTQLQRANTREVEKRRSLMEAIKQIRDQGPKGSSGWADLMTAYDRIKNGS